MRSRGARLTATWALPIPHKAAPRPGFMYLRVWGVVVAVGSLPRWAIPPYNDGFAGVGAFLIPVVALSRASGWLVNLAVNRFARRPRDRRLASPSA